MFIVNAVLVRVENDRLNIAQNIENVFCKYGQQLTINNQERVRLIVGLSLCLTAEN